MASFLPFQISQRSREDVPSCSACWLFPQFEPSTPTTSACGARMGFRSGFHIDATGVKGKTRECPHFFDGHDEIIVIDAKSKFRSLGSRKYSL